MQMSSRVNKTKHTVRPVTKPNGKKTRFDKPAKIRRRQKPDTFTDLSQLKDKMEEAEMRMGGTSVNAAKILKEVINEQQNTNDSIIDDRRYDVTIAAQETTPVDTPTHKVGLLGALRLGLRDTLFGQAVTAVMSH